MPLTSGIVFCLIKRRIISVKNCLFIQEITFRTEFPGSNLLQHTCLTGGNWDFEVANYLLATVNFEPWKVDCCCCCIVVLRPR